jgi:hypothetical protein
MHQAPSAGASSTSPWTRGRNRPAWTGSPLDYWRDGDQLALCDRQPGHNTIAGQADDFLSSTGNYRDKAALK